MITEEGFVKGIVILVQVCDNNARRLVLNHLHALTFIHTLVLGFVEFLLEVTLLFDQTLHPTVDSFNFVRELTAIGQSTFILFTNRICIHGIELGLKLVDFIAQFVDIALDFEEIDVVLNYFLTTFPDD